MMEAVQTQSPPEEWYLLQLDHRMSFGPPDLAAGSFTIFIRNGQGEFMRDQGAVYLNGQLLDRASLQAGDHIQCMDVQLIWLGSQMVCSRKLKGHPVQRIHPYRFPETSEGQSSGQRDQLPDLEPNETVCIKAEAPMVMSEPQKPHWFSSLGPCVMIMASSLAGAGMSLFKNPDDLVQAFSGMAPSLSMAAAFLGFGLINRRIMIRTSARPRENQKRMYESFLQEQAQRMEHAHNLQEAKSQRIVSLIASHDPLLVQTSRPEWKMPAGLAQVCCACIEMPLIRYDQKDNPMVIRLEQLARRNMAAYVPFCLQPKETVKISGFQNDYVDSLMEMFCWMIAAPLRRFVWIGSSWRMPFAHPALLYAGRKLYFTDLDEFVTFALAYPEMEWIVVMEEGESSSLPVQKLNAAWIVMNSSDPEALMPLNLPEIDWDAVRKSALNLYRDDQASSQYVSRLIRPGIQAADFRQAGACMAVDLDLDGRNVLNLETMGPHMLVAGTTGSGKSEGMTHILLQLSLNNSSRYLQYILIDFKGGAFGSVFYEFPHMAGYLTNMQTTSISRLEQALEAEIVRRQKKIAVMMEEHPFASADISSWNTHCPQDPISHLIVLVDEFASLKKSCPEFLDKLQESARIGRSLGVHLILATQKPAGVVDAQTFANARIRMSFMVQSAADSREVLGHDQAAALKKSGEYICEINGQSSMKGRIAYTRAPAGSTGTIRLMAGQKEMYAARKPLSILERASQLIFDQKEKQNWILCPDLSEILRKKDGIYQDQLSRLEKWEPAAGEPVWLQSSMEGLMAAVKVLSFTSRVPVYGCGLDHEDLDVRIPDACFWQTAAFESGLLVILADGLEQEQILQLLQNRKLVSIILSSQPLNRKEMLLKACTTLMASSLKDREEQYLLFGRGSDVIPAWPLVHGRRHKVHMRAAFCLSESAYRPKRQFFNEWICNPLSWKRLMELPDFLLGFACRDGHPVFWDRKKPLLIVYALPHLQKPISILLDIWKKQKPDLMIKTFPETGDISILELPAGAALLTKPQGIQVLYSSLVCFIGKGLRDWMYQLKLSGVSQSGGNCYLAEKEPVCLNLVEIS